MLALAPIVPVLVALGVAGSSALVWLWARGRKKQLGDVPKTPLGPGDEPIPKGSPSELVDLLTAEFTAGAFHPTQSGDSVNEVVTKTLNRISAGKGNDPQMIGAVRRLMNRSSFNRTLFGEPSDGTYAIDGIGVGNFAMPKHEDTIETMRLGFLPERNIDDNGKRIGPSQKWGDPWVPVLNIEAVKAGIEDPDLLLGEPWADGTPATEPPPELYAVLEERA